MKVRGSGDMMGSWYGIEEVYYGRGEPNQIIHVFDSKAPRDAWVDAVPSRRRSSLEDPSPARKIRRAASFKSDAEARSACAGNASPIYHRFVTGA